MFIIILLFILIFIFLWYNNNVLMCSYYNVTLNNSLCIVQISDLHNKSFGINQKHILNKIRMQSPDLIVITGDLVHNSKHKNAKFFIENVSHIAPTFFVSGNHEYIAKNYDSLKSLLIQNNITILDNKSFSFKKSDSVYTLYGIADPMSEGYYRNYSNYIKNKLDSFSYNSSSYNILLSHRPELLDLYSQYHIQLILCGHAHGGQFRFPFVGGFFAPNQGFFPKYCSGLHKKKNSIEIISRGLGNSVFPFRLFNRPEIVTIKL